MAPLDWFNTAASLIGLALGYITAHGQLQRFLRIRKLPKLLKEKEFYEKLQASPSERLAYLLETTVMLFAIAGAGTMFGAIPYFEPTQLSFEAVRLWLVGGILYLFALYRLGRYWNVTRRFQKTIDRINADIRKNEV